MQNREKPTITRIQIKVNVPFVRFKEYIEDLKERGLIKVEAEVSITEQGQKYLDEYQKVKEFLEKFGFINTDENYE